jgi:hypothetical protein
MLCGRGVRGYAYCDAATQAGGHTIHLADFALRVFALSLGALTLCAWLGANIAAKTKPVEMRADFNIVLTASLTLLGLIIGFSFSMALNRYDQRQNTEELEADAIGAAYLRAELMPAAAAARTQALLREYLDARVSFYSELDARRLPQLEARTLRLEQQLWSEVRAAAAAQPLPTLATVVLAMNAVLNTRADTQAAWNNRIPLAAWALMMLIAMLCNAMVGYAAPRLSPHAIIRSLLPMVLAIAFALIADIDSPRGGFIHVAPQNLLSLRGELH